MRTKTSIVKYPANVLSRVAEDVFYSKDYFERQLSTFRAACLIHGGVAVAAPQLGISSRFFFYNYGGESFMAINPVITGIPKDLPLVYAEEGCLSVPGKSFKVERYGVIGWSYTDIDGARRDEIAEGWKARIIQHEINHLDGICLPDLP